MVAHGLRLERPVGVEVHLARVAAVEVDNGPAGDGAVGAQVLGEGLDDLLGRGGHDVDPAPCGLVLLQQLERASA